MNIDDISKGFNYIRSLSEEDIERYIREAKEKDELLYEEFELRKVFKIIREPI